MNPLISPNLVLTDEVKVNPKPEKFLSDNLFFRESHLRKHLSGVWIPFIVLTIALFLFSLAAPVLALKKGDKGDDVTSLQKTLQAAGYFNGPITGYYGQLTEAAVKKFQQARGINPDGVAGTDTQGKLNSPTSMTKPREAIDPKPIEIPEKQETDTPSVTEIEKPQPEPLSIESTEEPAPSDRASFVLKRGDRNSQVSALQKNLQLSGYFPGPITGYYGTGTEAAVMKLQQAKGLKPDGIAGPKTRSVLESSPQPETPADPQVTSPSHPITDDRIGLGNNQPILQRGDRNSAVTTMQKMLQEKGYFNGPITGYYGALTEAAVKDFQKAKGLNPDGKIDIATQSALRSSTAAPTPATTPGDNPSPTPSVSPSINPDSPFNDAPFIQNQSHPQNTPEKKTIMRVA